MTSAPSLPNQPDSSNRRVLDAALAKAALDKRRGIYLPIEITSALSAFGALLDALEGR